MKFQFALYINCCSSGTFWTNTVTSNRKHNNLKHGPMASNLFTQLTSPHSCSTSEFYTFLISPNLNGFHCILCSKNFYFQLLNRVWVNALCTCDCWCYAAWKCTACNLLLKYSTEVTEYFRVEYKLHLNSFAIVSSVSSYLFSGLRAHPCPVFRVFEHEPGRAWLSELKLYQN